MGCPANQALEVVFTAAPLKMNHVWHHAGLSRLSMKVARLMLQCNSSTM